MRDLPCQLPAILFALGRVMEGRESGERRIRKETAELCSEEADEWVVVVARGSIWCCVPVSHELSRRDWTMITHCARKTKKNMQKNVPAESALRGKPVDH